MYGETPEKGLRAVSWLTAADSFLYNCGLGSGPLQALRCWAGFCPVG
jgi:hypothetical protein